MAQSGRSLVRCSITWISERPLLADADGVRSMSGVFAPPLRPPDLVGGASGFHDGPLIGRTECLGETGQCGLDEPRFEGNPCGLAVGIEFLGHSQRFERRCDAPGRQHPGASNSANRKNQITRHPWRTSSSLYPGLSFRYTREGLLPDNEVVFRRPRLGRSQSRTSDETWTFYL